jgi:hypothetical protein
VQTRPVEVPVALSQSVAVNAEFVVLLCLRPPCRKAIIPASAVEHFRKIHEEGPAVHKKVQAFVAGIPWEYDYASVRLPANGLAPQPCIPVVDGFRCWDCRHPTRLGAVRWTAPYILPLL